ncbi:hypothetical protein [Fusobacterium sp. MFO224]|uniref:hypothetical protein n=1 Tax=Fusobacterium sp. MFO224 TaxID=3378070 RepID=UPI0038520890
MKKLILLTLISLFIGCSNLPSIPSNNLSPSVSNKISEIIDSKNEIYGLGSKKISSTGSFVAEGKAKKESLNNLRKNIDKEVNTYFDDFLKNVDPYSKSMFLSSRKELINYATDDILLNASQKESFLIDGKIYVLSTVEKKDAFAKSKFTFLEYTSNIKKRLEKIYYDVNTNSFENIKNNSNESTLKNNISESKVLPEKTNNDISSTDFTSLEDDPLFL